MSIVSAYLITATSAGSTPNLLLLAHQSDGFEALRIVAAYGRTNHENLAAVRSAHSQGTVVCDCSRPDVERLAKSGRDPTMVEFHQRGDQRGQLGRAEIGERDPLAGVPETVHV